MTQASHLIRAKHRARMPQSRASIRRFVALHGYDHVRDAHLPPVLRDRNPGQVWRTIDGRWTQDDVP